MIMFPIRLNVSTGSQGWRLSYEILHEGNYLKPWLGISQYIAMLEIIYYFSLATVFVLRGT